MTEIESEITLSSTGGAPAHDPTPTLEHTPQPSGWGSVAVIKEGPDCWGLVKLDGPMRGRRIHTFDDVASFARFLTRHADPAQTEILVDYEEIVAALDPADPHGDLLKCQLVAHPTYGLWKASASTGNLPQRYMHRLVRGSEAALGPAYELLLGKLGHIKTLIADSGEVELTKTGLAKLVGGSRRTEGGESFPAEIEIETPIWTGIMHADVEPPGGRECSYRLAFLVHLELLDGQLVFELDCPALALHERAARDDVARYLQALLGDAFEVGLGDLAIRPAPDLRSVD